MFRGSVKGTGYPLHSPVSPSLPILCVTVCHHVLTGLYHILQLLLSPPNAFTDTQFLLFSVGVFRLDHVIYWNRSKFSTQILAAISRVNEKKGRYGHIYRRCKITGHSFCQQFYTGCNRRNGPDFGRVFLMLNYTEKLQNTYIQSSMVTEI